MPSRIHFSLEPEPGALYVRTERANVPIRVVPLQEAHGRKIVAATDRNGTFGPVRLPAGEFLVEAFMFESKGDSSTTKLSKHVLVAAGSSTTVSLDSQDRQPWESKMAGRNRPVSLAGISPETMRRLRRIAPLLVVAPW